MLKCIPPSCFIAEMLGAYGEELYNNKHYTSVLTHTNHAFHPFENSTRDRPPNFSFKNHIKFGLLYPDMRYRKKKYVKEILGRNTERSDYAPLSQLALA